MNANTSETLLWQTRTRRLIDATPKDDLGLIRKRVAEREKMRAAGDVS